MNSSQTTPLFVTVADPSAVANASSAAAAVTTSGRSKPGTVKPTAAATVRELSDIPELHDLANLFPPMSARAKAALTADIKQHGQQVPIILLNGKIIDGRHRAQSCVELGLLIKAVDYVGESDPSDLVWSHNSVRRDISQSQRGIVAAVRVNYPRSGGRLPAKKKGAAEVQNEVGNLTGFIGERRVLTTKEAALAVGVDPRTVTAGNAVCASKNKRLIEAVRSGNIAIEPAAKIARQLAQTPAEEHDAVIDRALKVDDEFAILDKRLQSRVVNALLQGKPVPDCEQRETVVHAVTTTFLEALRQVRAAIRGVDLIEEGERPESLDALAASCRALAARSKSL